MTESSPYQIDLDQIIEEQQKFRQENIKDVFNRSNKKISQIQQKMKKLFNQKLESKDKLNINNKNIHENVRHDKYTDFIQYEKQRTDKIKINAQENILQNQPQSKINKLTSSLKIFKKKNNTGKCQANMNNLNLNNMKEKLTNVRNQPQMYDLDNFQSHNYKDHQIQYYQNYQNNYSSSPYLTQSIFIPTPQVPSYISIQLQQLQIIQKLMHKNMKIKELRLKDLQDDIEKLQKQKIHEYKKGQALQKQIYTLTNKNSNIQKYLNEDSSKYQIQTLQNQKKQLSLVLKQLKSQLKQIKLKNKKCKSEQNLTQNQLKSILKSIKQKQKTKQKQKQKQHQISQSRNKIKHKHQIQDNVDSIKLRQNQKNKASTHRSIGTIPITKRQLEKYPLREGNTFSIHRNTSTDRLCKKFSLNTQNRHLNNACQHNEDNFHKQKSQKQQQNTKILCHMLDQLNKLKNVLNKQIIREKSYSLKKGKTVLSTFKNNQQKMYNAARQKHNILNLIR